MKEFMFWLPVTKPDGTKESIEFKFVAESWTLARKMMSDAIKEINKA